MVKCAVRLITRAAQHHALAQAVRAAIGKDAQAVLMSHHGAICGGRTLEEAILCCQFVEKAAQVFLMGQLLGGVKPLDEAHWREERDHYLLKYGRAADLEGVLKI